MPVPVQVYRAKLDGFNEVAVKVLAAESDSPAEERMRMFLEEINIMRACRDPHIVLFIGAWAHKVTQGCLASVPFGVSAASLAAPKGRWRRGLCMTFQGPIHKELLACVHTPGKAHAVAAARYLAASQSLTR